MIKDIRKKSLSFALISSMAFFSACGIDNDEQNVVGDNFVSAEVIDDINASTMLLYVKGGIDANATNAFGYKAVKITYNTKGQNDEDILASGLLVIPTASAEYQAYRAAMGEVPFSVSMIGENHGTIFTDAEAPTNSEIANAMPDNPLAVLMTGYAGFATIMPDYIGYGVSNDVNHPYMLKKASARDSLDMIRASVRYMTDTNVVFNSQLYISGYSQGGYTAMALAQEIEENHNDEFTLMGVAAMAAPHIKALGDIEIDASHTMVYPAFLGYLANSYANAYDDINLTDLVNETNTTKYNSLFDGSKSNVEIHAALGLVTDARGGFNQHTADVLFKPSLITDYQSDVNVGKALKARFIENDSDDWIPTTKLNLIHCVEDEIIPFSMSANMYARLLNDGVSAENLILSPIPTSYIAPASPSNPFIHGRCIPTAYGAAVKWFAALRTGN